MTAATVRPSLMQRRAHLATVDWHRPLLWLAAAMVLLIGVALVGVILDPRELTGAPIWMKPLKFAISVLIYSVTLSWLIGLVHRGRRLARIAGTVAAVFLAVEMVVITGAAATGVTSHFNVATPLATTLWAIMAGSIGIVWVASLVIAAVLFRAKLGDRGRSLAIRSGFVIALVGMALGFLMTSPTAAQLDDFQGIAGAHAVGVADGGPGLPLVGWSTVAGDLRIPHFVGMHALQALPILALALELASRRVSALRSESTRFRLLWIAVGCYAGTLAILTTQALIGQSIVQPAGVIPVAAAALFAAAAVAVLLALRTGQPDPSTTR
jgi:hypothetical protein